MQAMILAAGMGKRLKNLTAHNTKCMIKVDEITLIERMLKQIQKFNFSRIVIVVGYEGQKLKDFIATLNVSIPIIYIKNPIYDKTNNIYSLSLASNELIKDDTMLFDEEILDSMSILYLIGELETKFDVELPPDEVVQTNYETVERIAEYVAEKM